MQWLKSFKKVHNFFRNWLLHLLSRILNLMAVKLYLIDFFVYFCSLLLITIYQWLIRKILFFRADPTDRALSRKLRNLTKLTNLLIADLKTSITTYRDLFRETLNVDYVELACKEYEKHLGILAKNLVTTVCDRLVLNQRRLRFGFCVLNFLSQEELTQN